MLSARRVRLADASLWPVAKSFATALYLPAKVPLAVWGLLTLILGYTTRYLTFSGSYKILEHRGGRLTAACEVPSLRQNTRRRPTQRGYRNSTRLHKYSVFTANHFMGDDFYG